MAVTYIMIIICTMAYSACCPKSVIYGITLLYRPQSFFIECITPCSCKHLKFIAVIPSCNIFADSFDFGIMSFHIITGICRLTFKAFRYVFHEHFMHICKCPDCGRDVSVISDITVATFIPFLNNISLSVR